MNNIELTKANKADRILIVMGPLAISFLTYHITRLIANHYVYFPEIANGMDICKMLIGIWSTLLGFLIAALSMLLAINNNTFIKVLRNTNHYKTVLFSYILSSLYMLVAIIFAVFIVISNIWNKGTFYSICSISVGTFLSLLFCIYFLFVIVLREDVRE